MDDFHFHYPNLYKHKVTDVEALEAFLDPNAVDITDRKGLFTLLGQTMSHRLLEIGYKENNDGSIYIFHAMDARKGHLEVYRGVSK